jgi:hypothetical protein
VLHSTPGVRFVSISVVTGPAQVSTGVRRLLVRSKLLCLLLSGVLAILLLLLAPVIARIGAMQTLRMWGSTPGALGLGRPLTLSFQRYVAYVDVLAWYPTYRLLITDGGYAYVHEFQIPSADSKAFAQGSRVTWDTNKVEFTMPGGETLIFPAKVVTQQVGP